MHKVVSSRLTLDVRNDDLPSSALSKAVQRPSPSNTP